VSVELDEWLSEQEAAEAIKKSIRTLRDWRRKGLGPPYAFSDAPQNIARRL
jgi:hypothetical protein